MCLVGVGALFLSMQVRSELADGKESPVGEPVDIYPPYSDSVKAVYLVWPVVCFVVLGSTMVHGLSVLGISLAGHFSRKKGERAPLLAAETEGLHAMEHEGGGGESEPEVSGSDDGDSNFENY